MMNPFESIFDELRSQGLVGQCHYFDTIDSTNSAARRMALEYDLKYPALLVADNQTQGRGRGGHSWWSPDGCLMFTLVLSAASLPEQRNSWSQLALITGVAAADAIESICPELEMQLKWPNDLYFKGRKVGGILIESFNLPSELSVENSLFAIGVGINTAMHWQAAPIEVQIRATCLSSACDRHVERQYLLHEFIQQLQQRLSQWKFDSDNWLEDWHPRCFLSGKVVTVNTSRAASPQLVTGRCEGVARDGQLLIRSETGAIQPINVGEVISWW
ncbi:MAG: biotin--[acetyl-CoA-carboxylase] ligase [Pirellulales bacterium]